MAEDRGESAGRAGAFWADDLADVLRHAGTDGRGLSRDEAARRLARDGPNRVDLQHRHRGPRLLLAQFTSPIILILTAATVVSMALGDIEDGAIILAIILASGALGFWQGTAGRAVDALPSRVQVRVEVCREGREVSVPVDDVVTGDLVVLNAGDVIQADCRVTDARALKVDQSALTGEPFPVEKKPETSPADASVATRVGALSWVPTWSAARAGRSSYRPAATRPSPPYPNGCRPPWGPAASSAV